MFTKREYHAGDAWSPTLCGWVIFDLLSEHQHKLHLRHEKKRKMESNIKVVSLVEENDFYVKTEPTEETTIEIIETETSSNSQNSDNGL